jgi:glucose-1-phosphate thymidylyltransferase
MRSPGAVSKCVILARGLGTRMREDDGKVHLDEAQSVSANSGLKAMVPVGRPFLDYVLSALADAGFRQVCLVIGPEHSTIRDYYTGANKPTRIQVSFAEQLEARGTADAVLAAEEFAGAHEFAVINSDNYYPADALRDLQDLAQPGVLLFDSSALVRQSNIPTERIQSFAFCLVDQEGFLVEVVEKPDVSTAAQFPGEKLISMNCWRFGPSIFPVCRQVPLSPRGEFELPSAVRLAIRRGMRFKVVISRSGVLDLSRRSDITIVTDRLRNVQVQL